MAVSHVKCRAGTKGSGKCTGTEREKEGAGGRCLKVAGSGRKRRKIQHCKIFCN